MQHVFKEGETKMLKEKHEKEMGAFIDEHKNKLIKLGVKNNEAILFCAEFAIGLTRLMMRQKTEFDDQKQ